MTMTSKRDPGSMLDVDAALIKLGFAAPLKQTGPEAAPGASRQSGHSDTHCAAATNIPGAADVVAASVSQQLKSLALRRGGDRVASAGAPIPCRWNGQIIDVSGAGRRQLAIPITRYN